MLMCGNATECPQMQAGVWTLTDFLANYMRTPENLVKEHDPAVRATQRSLEEILDDRDAHPPGLDYGAAEFERRMWEEVPWVACSKGNCSKTISKVTLNPNP